MSFTWAPNVTFLMDENLSSVYFEELNTEVYGFSYHTAEITEAKADNISLPASRRTRILMLHGGDAKHVPFDRNALAASPFSYIAWDISTNRRFFWKTAWPTPVPRNRLT